MTWRDVFDCKEEAHMQSRLENYAELAWRSGYKFLAFDGEIYFKPDLSTNPTKTGLTVESELKN